MGDKLFKELLENIGDQKDLFIEVAKVNLEFRDSIINRNWKTVNDSIDTLNKLSLEVSKLEGERVDLLVNIARDFRSKESEDFFSLINKAPIELKDTLTSEYYALRSAITTAKGVYKGLNDYIEHKKEVSKEVIDMLVKDSKGNVYTKPGRKELGSKGFLVNRQL